MCPAYVTTVCTKHNGAKVESLLQCTSCQKYEGSCLTSIRKPYILGRGLCGSLSTTISRPDLFDQYQEKRQSEPVRTLFDIELLEEGSAMIFLG